MRKYFSFILMFVIPITFFPKSIFIQNEDKPLKGNWDFRPELLWKIDQAGSDLLARIGSIRVDDEGNIYVMEIKQGKIYVFDKSGKFLYNIGKRGEGPGEYKRAFNFFLVKNKVIVPDMGRIHFFSKDGKFIRTYIEKSMVFPRAFVDDNRMIYVKSDREGMGKSPEKVNIFNFKTKKEKTIMIVPPEKAIAAQSGGMRIVIKDSQTTPVVIVSVIPGGILMGKSDRYEIKKIDLNGKELMKFSLSGRSRKPISEKFKKKRFEDITFNGGKMPKKMVEMMIKNMPDVSTYFGRIITGPKGNIYVYISDLENENGQEIDIFSPEGKYIYHGELKFEEYKIKSAITMKNGYVYLFGEDEDGEGYLMKFRISIP